MKKIGFNGKISLLSHLIIRNTPDQLDEMVECESDEEDKAEAEGKSEKVQGSPVELVE